MFKAVAMNKTFDTASLAEALIYYGRIELTVGHKQLVELLKVFGYDQLVRALEAKYFSVTYDDSMISAGFRDIPSGQRAFSIGQTRMKSRSNGVEWTSFREGMMDRLLETIGITKENRRKTDHIASLITYGDSSDKALLQTERDIRNDSLMDEIAKACYSVTYPDLNIGYIRFEEVEDCTFVPISDLPFADLESDDPNTNPALLAAMLLGLNDNVLKSADGNTDIWFKSEHMSALLNAKFAAISKMYGKSANNISEFESLVFDKFSFRELIDSKQRTMKDVLDLLEEPDTAKMKKWLLLQDDNLKLTTEYHKAIFSADPGLKGKMKLGKMVLCGAATTAIEAFVTQGLPQGLGLVAGGALGLALDHGQEVASTMYKRAHPTWKPDQWVSGPASSFLR